MNVLIWKQSNDSLNLLNNALQNLTNIYGEVNVLGVIDNTPRGIDIELSTSSSHDYDLIIITGAIGAFKSVVENVAALNLDPEKAILDSTVGTYDFNLERYKKLKTSKLSIISMDNFGAIIGEIFGLPNSAVNLNFTEENFLKFLKNLFKYLNGEVLLNQTDSEIKFLIDDISVTANYLDVEFAIDALESWRANFNPFNTLFVMHTENPEVLAEFDKLPYEKKICFVPFETNLDSGFYIKPYYLGGESISLAMQKIALQEHTCYNLWDILLSAKKTPVNLHDPRNNVKNPYGNHFQTSNGKIKFFNWWDISKNPDESFFARLIENNVSNDKTFNIFSVHGNPDDLKNFKGERKVLIANEEIYTWPWYDGYQGYLLDYADLVLGNDYLAAPNYMRFSYILWRFLKNKIDKNFIAEKVAAINSSKSTCKYDCCSINLHDMMNTRAPICDRLKDILQIHYAGNWRNNTDELHTVYGNDKLKYVHEFKFNICPENCNRFGYVSEKIFDAFEAGAIPIYYGSDNNPEEGIINKDAVLFWDLKGDNEAIVKEIIRLKFDEDYYAKFMRQEKLFSKAAVDYVHTSLEELARRLREF